MEFNKSEKTLMAVSTIILVLSGALLVNALYLNNHSTHNIVIDALQKDIKNIRTVLQVDVYDVEGNLRESRLKDDDLILDNFGNWMSGWFEDATNVGKTLKRTSGSTTSVGVKSTSPSFCWTANYDVGAMAGVGTGTTAPTTGDYDLETQIGDWTKINNPTYADGNITFGCSIQSPTAQDITEAGVIWTYSDQSIQFLVLRDTFSAVSTGEGESITLTYTIVLGSGFTDNFGNILAQCFEYTEDSTNDDYIYLIDYGNVNRTCRVQYDDNVGVFRVPPTRPSTGIWIGTGTTAPDRSDYHLVTPVESLFGVSEPSWNTGDGGNATVSATIRVTANREITEAGFYQRTYATDSTSILVLLWRTTFAAESIASGEYCTITFGIYS
jgi:hypothetical protein